MPDSQPIQRFADQIVPFIFQALGAIIDIDMRDTALQAEGKIILILNQNVFSNVVVVSRPHLPANPQVHG